MATPRRIQNPSRTAQADVSSMGLTINIPPPVDRYGNIALTGRSGVNWAIQWQAQGAPYDVSDALILFEIDGILRAPLGPAPTAATFTGSISGSVLAVTAMPYGAWPWVRSSRARPPEP